MADHPIEVVQATLIQPEQDPCLISIGEVLNGEAGLRTEILVEHRFPSAAARGRFFDWFTTGQNYRQAEALIEIAFESGTNALSQVLDDLAKPAAPNERLTKTSRKSRVKAAA